MKQKGKRTLTPKLRFPEFREEPGWVDGRCGDIADVLQGYGFPERYQGAIEGVYPFYKVSDISNAVEQGEKYITQANNYISDRVLSELGAKPVPAGTTIFAKIGEAIRSNRRAVTTKPSIVDNNVAGVKVTSGKTSDDFLYYLWSNISLIDFAGGVVPAISKSAIESIPVAYTEIEAEQKKISECLSSLDGLIAAEGRKLAALRDHKRGLMQQLFPQPGETQPRLRFPEFRNKGEWERHTLGNIVNISKGKGVAKADIVEGGATPCIRYAELYTTYGEVITQVRSQTNVPIDDLVLSKAGDVIIPASGETKEDIATCACVIDAGVALGSDLNVLRSGFDGRFFSYYLNGAKRSELAKVAQGDTVAHLYPSQISQLNIALPSNEDEQQRIADCLIALDSLVNSQAAKIETLKQHNRGLMQQLFPAP